MRSSPSGAVVGVLGLGAIRETRWLQRRTELADVIDLTDDRVEERTTR